MRRFDSKVILITGGTSGIGLATARRLLDEGATVVATGHDDEHMARARDSFANEPRLALVPSDAGSVAASAELVARIAGEHGRLDGLFANAGTGLFKPLRETTEDDFDRVFAIDVKGVFFLVKEAARLLRAGSSVLLTASWTARRGLPEGHVYSASKAAVASLARTLASELGREGIRVNAISPGYVDTPIIRFGEEEKTKHARELPLGRWARPDEIAAAAAYMLSEDASYVCGQDFVVDGGLVGAHTYR